MKLSRILLFFIIAFSSVLAKAEVLNIGVLANKKVTSFIFSPQVGSYNIYTENGKLLEISIEDIVQLSYSNNNITLKTLDKDLGSFKKVKFIGTSWRNSFKIKTNKPEGKITFYEDNLLVSINNYYNQLTLINNVDIDNYVGGVVESEVGRSPPAEYFKLQAIICRTYALKNIDRHQPEGFSLCDQVHCQAYNGQPKSIIIKEAAIATKNIVIVDSDINLITATFYSNCGGQTANSEDVWRQSVYYLRSVTDTFCRKENNAIWTKKIPKTDWINYLTDKHNHPKEELYQECGLDYFQCRREQHFENQNIKIPFVDLRKDWNLKSALFDVVATDNEIILQGKGYGHGVGLCQEGAMRMAKLGYSYAEILHFYYKDVHMIDLQALDFFKEDF
ncbi:MAG: SpoIID/LytB domain-containing protein [Flavobacteriales bacterium]|nr:SpoIID/LytB domain-containing protein [Flavobacteriales bacterium]MCB9174435.1 SpoIID/LytB domain-containing protein [Flavobacteriales bacterium]